MPSLSRPAPARGVYAHRFDPAFADAERAVAAIPAAELERVDTGHGFHVEDPEAFITLLEQLAN